MDVEAATVIEVFPAEESELASLDFVVGDASFRGRGAHAWATDGAEGEEEQEEKRPPAAEANFGGRPESQRPESPPHLPEIRPKSSWVGFIDFGQHAGDEGEERGLSPATFAGARGARRRRERKRRERVRPVSGGEQQRKPSKPGPGPPAAPGVPAISLTEPTPPASLSEDSDGGDRSRPASRRGRKRGSGVEALDKYHWHARKKRKSNDVGNVVNGGEAMTRSDRAKAAEGSRTTTKVLEKNGEVLAHNISLSSKAISTSSLRSVDSAAQPCTCGPKHGGRLCQGAVLVSLGMAIAWALYFGALTADSPSTVAQLMDGYNCSALTDCKTRGEGIAALASSSTNETGEALSAGDICALDHCLAPCSAVAAAVKRCGDGLCVLKRECEDFSDEDAAAEETRFALLGILVFAICCLVGAVAVMTPCTQRLCSHCFLRNRRGGGHGDES